MLDNCEYYLPRNYPSMQYVKGTEEICEGVGEIYMYEGIGGYEGAG